MSSLYNRATPRQAKVLRMIEGAVINAAHAHPDWSFDPRLTKSIAKRATGTLTAQWPDVLAMPQKALSNEPTDNFVTVDSTEASLDTAPAPHGRHRTTAGEGRAKRRGISAKGGASQTIRRTPSVAYLQRVIGAMAARAKRHDECDRAEALIDALKVIASIVAHEGRLPRRWPLNGDVQ